MTANFAQLQRIYQSYFSTANTKRIFGIALNYGSQADPKN